MPVAASDLRLAAVPLDGPPIETGLVTTAPPAVSLPTPVTELKEQRPRREATIVIVGDTGLGGSMMPVHPDGGVRQGSRVAWSAMTGGIRHLINGDLNFANLETVVTDRNDLTAVEKAFNFRTHPAGVQHLTDIGFNVFSTANNHAADFGERGVRETLAHLARLEGRGMQAHAGVGSDREAASRPSVIDVKGTRVLLSAIGIGAGANRAGDQRPGQLAYGSHDDFARIVSRLEDTPGDYRMLSVHHGIELDVTPGEGDVRKLRDSAVRDAGVDLVIGHHQHVAQGVQEVDGKLIFYGLGNFLHLGTQDMSRFNMCRDYGLLARVHLASGADGRLAAQAIEVVPLTGMHARTAPMRSSEAAARVQVLNHLARGLDHGAGIARGVRFVAQPDGAGLACLAGAEQQPGRIGALCKGWREPDAPSEALARQIQASCGGGAIAAASRARVAEATVGTAAAPVRSGRRAAASGAAKSGGNFFTSLFGN